MSTPVVFIRFTNRDTGKDEWVRFDRIIRVTECQTEGHAGYALLLIETALDTTLIEADETPEQFMERLRMALG